MRYGFAKVAAAVPAVRVADVDYNIQQIESLIAQAEGRDIELMVFPELCVTGYSCQDLFKEQLLLDKVEEGVMVLLDFTRKLDIISVVGLPVVINGLLYNCAAVIQGGSLLGIVPKTYLPNYGEFYEKRWFASAQDLNPTDIYFAGSPVHVSAEPQLFVTRGGMKFGIEICEDVWAPIPPSNNLALAGADIILIPEIPYHIDKVIEAIDHRTKAGKGFTVIAVAEGAISAEDAALSKKELKKKMEEKTYPSVAYELAQQIEERTGTEVRITVPGHTQRGGSPCPYDRVLSTRLGVAAAKLILDEQYGYMVGIVNGKTKKVPLKEVAGKLKTVSPNDQMIKEIKLLGISFGD